MDLHGQFQHQEILKQSHQLETLDEFGGKQIIDLKSEYKEIRGSDYFALLKYLIGEGYIDETYADYMTYFYPNSLSVVDKKFLRSVRDKQAKEYTYSLKNPALTLT